MRDIVKDIKILGDMIEGEVNRMCVTQEEKELDAMFIYAVQNIVKLRELRRIQFLEGKKHRIVYSDTDGISILEDKDDALH